MPRYSQKYSLVSFLDPVALGDEFDMDTWPLHTTICGVFFVEWNPELLANIASISKTSLPINTHGIGEDYWGKNGEYHVMKLEKTAEIDTLHRSVLTLLQTHDAKFNSPEFEGDGYLPHATIQKHTGVKPNEEVALTNLAIVDMFVGGDYRKRKIIHIFPAS